ncbi:hypothetical protein HYW84_03005 [Candidatus Peregrinibacteria bacterium]|nr:hypothetical protein [Candidatus Peregrinibacteria bacterium]
MPTCAECIQSFAITDRDRAFYRKMDVPPPKSCPDCRFMRRLAERNARTLYKRKCDLTGREFISPYHPDRPFPVYHPDTWWGDGWDETAYGRSADFSRPFFDQLGELLNEVPHQGQFVVPGTMQNSDYVNCAGYLKDCYLIAETDYNENCYYGNRIFYNKAMVDCSNVYENELCYECIDCRKSYGLKFCEECENCSGSFFLSNCIACRDCISCINQRQKHHMIMNQQLTEEEYEKRKAALELNTYDGLQKMRRDADEFFLTQPHKAVQNEHNERSTGNHLYNSKDCEDCYDCKDVEDCVHCARVFSVKSSMDYTSWGDRSELMYQCASSGDRAYNLKFCTTCTTGNSNLEYCARCSECSDCFGCVGMRKKKHCIFNKQYSKEEYAKLRDQLITRMKQSGEWGEFFPKSLCPFAYNETIAMEYFPLAKEEALKRGYAWRDPVDDPPNVPRTISAEQLPQTIVEVSDDVLNWAVTCPVTGRPFRIIRQELAFYLQMDLPLPRKHPDQRHAERIARRSGVRMYSHAYAKCSRDIQTTYAPERPEIVYCEPCYLKTVY